MLRLKWIIYRNHNNGNLQNIIQTSCKTGLYLLEKITFQKGSTFSFVYAFNSTNTGLKCCVHHEQLKTLDNVRYAFKTKRSRNGNRSTRLMYSNRIQTYRFFIIIITTNITAGALIGFFYVTLLRDRFSTGLCSAFCETRVIDHVRHVS
jgi:hypothetical protein